MKKGKRKLRTYHVRVFVFQGAGRVTNRRCIIKARNLIDLIERADKHWYYVGGIYIQSIHRLVPAGENEYRWYRLTRPNALSNLRAVTLHRRTH